MKPLRGSMIEEHTQVLFYSIVHNLHLPIRLRIIGIDYVEVVPLKLNKSAQKQSTNIWSQLERILVGSPWSLQTIFTNNYANL